MILVRRRALVPAVLAALLAVAGCAAPTTAGTGSLAGTLPASGASSTGGLPSGSTGTATPTGTAGPSGSTRTPPDTKIGDPLTADVCTAMPLSLFASFGTATYDRFQNFGECDIDFGTNGDSLEVYAIAPSDAPSTAGATKRTVSGLTVYSLAPEAADCERLIVATDVVIDVYAYGSVAATVCKIADTPVDSLAAAVAGGTLPRRPVAEDSITAEDVCSAIDAEAVSAIPGIGGPVTIKPFQFGAYCDGHGTKLTVVVDSGLQSTPDPQWQPTRAGSHTVEFDPADCTTESCIVSSVQGVVSGSAVHEVLRFVALVGSGTPQTAAELKTIVLDLATAVLTELGR